MTRKLTFNGPSAMSKTYTLYSDRAIQYVKQFKREKPKGPILYTKTISKRQYDRQQPTTTIALQVFDFRPTHIK